MKDVSVILLAGGKGSRMNLEIPKQFLPLGNQLMVHYSFHFFTKLSCVKEIVVVSEPKYQTFFQQTKDVEIRFALPGITRQLSVFNGLQEVSSDAKLVCTHDGARPFLDEMSFYELVKEARANEAATLAVPLKFTVKEKDRSNFVTKTHDRAPLVEIQTPQIIHYDLLKKGFKYAQEKQIEVTDDVSLVELLQKPVKLVMGSYQNIKITTVEDLELAEMIVKRGQRS